MTRSRRVKLLLTHRAIRDLQTIRAQCARMGGAAAEKYLNQIQQALKQIRERPGLLKPVGGTLERLGTYRFPRHALLFEVQPSGLVLLAIVFGGFDLFESGAGWLPNTPKS